MSYRFLSTLLRSKAKFLGMTAAEHRIAKTTGMHNDIESHHRLGAWRKSPCIEEKGFLFRLLFSY